MKHTPHTSNTPDDSSRSRSSRFRRLAILGLAMAVVASACSSSDGDDDAADVDVVAPSDTTALEDSSVDSESDTPTDTQPAADDEPAATTPPSEDESATGIPVACVPGSGATFAGQELFAQVFEGDLSCSDFSESILAQPLFSDVDVSGASFRDAELAQPVLENATAIGTDFGGATFAQALIEDSDLRGAVLDGARFVGTVWENTICPDGRNSDELGGTCEGAGDPLAVAFGATAVADDSDDEQATDSDTDTGDQPTAARAPVALSSCTGFAVGSYRGDDQGPIVARLDDDGSLYSVFVSPAGLDVDIFEISDLADLGLEFGTDVRLEGTTIVIDPGAITVDQDGARLGNIELDLIEIGSVDADGQILAIAVTGALVTGTYDFTNCTASGEWANIGLSGTWQVGPTAAVVSFDDDDCAGGVYVGTTDAGGVAIDLDAGCLASQAQDLAVDATTSIADVEISSGDGLVVYAVGDSVLFELDSFEITPQARATLEAVAADIAARGGARVDVIGHTDALGSESYNLDLSIARADAVGEVLDDILREVDLDVTAIGLGESSPVAPNRNPDGSDNPAGRALNRRVEIIVSS